MIDCVVAPVDHVFPLAEEDVNVTEPPVQKVVDPLAVMVGATGIGFAVTLITLDETDEHAPSTIVAE